MKKNLFLFCLVLFISISASAQRRTDNLDRGLVAMKATSGVYLSWRINGEEYYDVTYNVYRDGVKITDTPLTVSNYTDKTGTTANEYTVAAVVRGNEQAPCKPVKAWSSSYKEIKLTHEGIKSTLVPNDACCADVDGDGELEILMKFDNLSEMEQSYPKYGPTIDGVATKEYSIFECLKQDGTRLWWVNCGPNMGDFQNNEQNIVGYDWDGDGRAEVVMRAASGTVIHKADGTTFTVGNKNTNVRGATGGGTNWFVITTEEYLVYMDGQTGEVYQCIAYPLPLLESGESDVNKAWGDGYGHRASKHFFGAPYLDGRKPSIFLARGIYTRHKMIAYDVDPTTHTLKVRWTWYNNSNGPWKGQGYHNYAIADVDWDGRDEIVFGSMVIDDNGKGLSTTGLGHGDASHTGDLNPYIHGQEIYACMEDNPGNNYRDATTSKIYHRFIAGNDDGRAMAGNFTNSYPGSLGCSAREGAISLITNDAVSGLNATGVNTNFRIYWDGDLCEETFNYLSGKNTEGCIAKYGSWTPIYTCAGSMTNNDTKGTPCYQGDIFGDWREEIIMRTADNNIRIYSTPTSTKYRNYTLWHDHQYRNAMVWQMCGYNQPPHTSYFLGEMEGITMAPPPLTMTGREEVANGGSIGSSLNGKHVIVCETKNSTVAIEDGAKPYILTFNVPTWVQGSAPSECTTKDTKITYTKYTCDVTGGAITGDARLVKQGDGILNLPKKAFTHTGETNIWAGTLNFDGTMKNSDLWLNRFAELNSDGGEFKSIKADYASVIRPGGEDKKGTITVDGQLTLGFGSRLVVDLFSEGNEADLIKANSLKLERKSSSAWVQGGPQYLNPVIEVVGHLANGETSIKAGKYVICEFNGEIDGNVSTVVLEGLASTKKNLLVEDGKLIVEIIGLRDANSVVWTGSTSSIWDFAETENFALNDETTSFVSGDEVVFDDNATNKTVTMKGNLMPKSITVNTESTYTFNGTGTITGTTTFTKEGTGTVSLSGDHSYTGGNFLKGGTTKVSQLSNQYSATGNLGGITKNASLFTMENAAILQTTANVEMGSYIKMVGTDGGVIDNPNEFLMDGVVSGTLLTKKGSGSLKFNANNSLSKLIITAGAVDCNSGNPASTIELQGGSLWDNTQATSCAIVVPKGKTSTWNLTNTYYTAYGNTLTGEGTLIINPRNTVSRVRITGNWSNFQGTIKHTNTSIWLPLDASTGLPKGTLDIAEGCGVTNVAKTFTIGKLTGKGSLNHPVANFQNQNAVNGSNTWRVGNSSDELGDFTFEGIIADGGGSNKALFEKIGTCKMTVKGAWTNSGSVKVSAGRLQFTQTASLGTGVLTVAKDAILAGVTAANGNLTNSSVTVNGKVIVGVLDNSASGVINFGGKNVTFNDGSTLLLNMRRGATSSITGGTSIQNIGTLTMNGTVEVNVTSSFTAEVGDSVILWKATKMLGTPKLASAIIDVEKGLFWDDTDIAKGILRVTNVAPVGIANVYSNDENATIYTISGRRVSTTNPKLLQPGIYIRNGRKFIVR